MTLDELRGRATCSVEEAAQILGIGRRLAYESARRGELPTLRLGSRVLVSVPRLIALVEGEERDG